MRLRFLSIAVIGVAVISCAAAGLSGAASPSYTTVNPGEITVATYGNGFPTIAVQSNGTLGGTSGAWINAFAKAHGLKVKLFQTTFTSALLAVQSGKADLTLDIYYNPARGKQMLYTYPFSVEGLEVFTKKSFPWTGASSLTGKKVAAVTGVVWDSALQKTFGSNLQLYPSQPEAATALLNGQVDAYFEADAQYFAPPISKSPDIVAHNISPGEFGVPGDLIKSLGYLVVNCKESSLVGGLDQTLASLELSGQWTKDLKAAGAPAGSLPDQTPSRVRPAMSC